MRTTSTVLGVVLAASMTAAASAGPTFSFIWSGNFYGNNALAEGTITFADGFPRNPGDRIYTVGLQVLNLDVTVSGASSGNGTFTTSAFNAVVWDTGGTTLDLSTELVGQATPGGPWGLTGNGANGDFNLFSTGSDPSAPTASFIFQLTTNNGSGDRMGLVSVRQVPAPAALPLLGLAGLGAARRRR